MILVDANVPMYIVGADHPNKVAAQRMLERAVTHRDLILAYSHLSAQDAIRVAIMQSHAVTRIMSFDTAFDTIPGLTRIWS